jgi:hypothetical protein
VADSGVSADQQPSAGHQRSQVGQIEVTRQNRVLIKASTTRDGETTTTFCGGARENDGMTGPSQGSSHCAKAIHRPATSLS